MLEAWELIEIYFEKHNGKCGVFGRSGWMLMDDMDNGNVAS